MFEMFGRKKTKLSKKTVVLKCILLEKMCFILMYGCVLEAYGCLWPWVHTDA